jgi:hypothetical protein
VAAASFCAMAGLVVSSAAAAAIASEAVMRISEFLLANQIGSLV